MKRRRSFLLTVIAAVFFAAVLGGFFFIRMTPISQLGKSSVTVLVEDSYTGRPLVGLMIEITVADGQSGGALAETDESGRVAFANLSPGLTTFRVGLSGFKDFFQAVRLGRGDNEDIVFSLELATTCVRGRILDAITEEPVEGAVVTLGGVRGETDADGCFSFDEVVAGTPILKVRKSGYELLLADTPLVKGVTEDLGDIYLESRRSDD